MSNPQISPNSQNQGPAWALYSFKVRYNQAVPEHKQALHAAVLGFQQSFAGHPQIKELDASAVLGLFVVWTRGLEAAKALPVEWKGFVRTACCKL